MEFDEQNATSADNTLVQATIRSRCYNSSLPVSSDSCKRAKAKRKWSLARCTLV